MKVSVIEPINGDLLDLSTPPSAQQQSLLAQILCAGYIDQGINLTIFSVALYNRAASGSRLKVYDTLTAGEAFLHPRLATTLSHSSFLFSKSPPPCIIYREVIETSRRFLKGFELLLSDRNYKHFPGMVASAWTFALHVRRPFG